MNRTINFISKKFYEFEKDKREKDDIIKNLWKRATIMAKKIEKLENLVDQQEQYSRRTCLLVHGIAEANDENMDVLAFLFLNDK